VTSPSDLGHRVRHRRQEVGLSVEKAAAGASMDPGYLDYLETAADPDPSRATLVRLSIVLDTSVRALLGSDQDLPPGQGGEASASQLIELDRDTCLELIAPGGVGRCVFLEARGPVAIPVNFGVLAGDVVFRTDPSTTIAAHAQQRRISFEVDHIDDALAEGWSVLVSGPAHRVDDPAELAAVRALGVTSWAPGERGTYFRLRAAELSGRRIRRVT
jgi:nitroimidazol reductase NimA-like FMN-containing flavoprotein (pyridoxamine 5'-phosphate oxidase superfamily)